jgi:hypothetical protein
MDQGRPERAERGAGRTCGYWEKASMQAPRSMALLRMKRTMAAGRPSRTPEYCRATALWLVVLMKPHSV